VVNSWSGDIDSLKVTTSGSAAAAVLNTGRLSLLNGYFTGASGATAVVSQGLLFARNINTTGFQRAITQSGGKAAAPADANVGEYSSLSDAGMWYTPHKSMNMQIKYPPFPRWESDTSKWISMGVLKGMRVKLIFA